MASSERSERQAAASEPKREVSPLERAKQIAASMSRSEKDARWLGVRMENFLRRYEARVDRVRVSVVCDYLEQLMRNGQADWQVKQSLDAIGLLMTYGYERADMGIPQLREAWGERLNQRVGISVAEPHTAQTGHGTFESPTVIESRRIFAGSRKYERAKARRFNFGVSLFRTFAILLVS